MHLALDGNGRPCTELLAQNVASSIVEYAIPRSTVKAALDMAYNFNHTGEVAKLYSRARELFVDLDRTGEGGEAFLFALCEQLLSMPQVLSKMSLKTNTKLHYNGSDGIHAKIDKETGKLLLYFCESKMYTDVNSGLNSCFESAAPFLLTPPILGTAPDHEMYLVSEFNKIGDEELAEKLVESMRPGSIAFQSTEFCLAVFVGFDSDVYPPNVDATLDAVKEAVEIQVDKWVSASRAKLLTHKLEAFRVIVFLLPFDSVQNFRNIFLKSIGVRSE